MPQQLHRELKEEHVAQVLGGEATVHQGFVGFVVHSALQHQLRLRSVVAAGSEADSAEETRIPLQRVNGPVSLTMPLKGPWCFCRVQAVREPLHLLQVVAAYR